MRVTAILLAAGRGKRMGASIPKAFLILRGKPIFLYSVETFFGVAEELALVVPKEFAKRAAAELLKTFKSLRRMNPGLEEEAVLAGRGKTVRVVLGGRERQDSVENGLKAVGPEGVVAVHDTARALVTRATIRRVLKAAPAIAAVPARDTLKMVGPGGVVEETLDRRRIWHAETPQAFPVSLLRRAFERARRRGTRGTDCATLVEKLGVKVRVVLSEGPNPKITTPEDLAAAEALLGR